MPVKNDRQYRSATFQVRAAAEGESEKYIAEGYATTWERYPLYEWGDETIYEKFDREDFAGVNMDDVIFQYDHQGMVYARMHNDTLQVSTDDHGLKVVADLSKTADARNMYENIMSGNVYQMSWAFTVDKDDFDKDTHTRTIRHIKKMYDVSAVSIPANPSTEISIAQQRIQGAMEELRQELVERERKIKTLKILAEVYK